MTESAALSRVLFVDDEPRILFSLKALFRADYDVTIAHSGAEALDVLKARDFDIVVSDQRMPRMTGIEVLRAARELRPRAVRLLLTGYSDLNAIIGSINEGEIFRFVNKPWNNDELRATLGDAARAAKVEQIVAPPAAQAAAAAADPAAVGVGVMVLDDDPSAREELRATLGSGHPLYAADSLERCVGLLEQHPDIGVIVTETTVAGEQVAPVLNELRQRRPSLVTIVITAEADATRAINLINHSQIYRLLQKPASAGVLRGTVNLASRRSTLLKQNPEQASRLPAMPPPPPAKALEASGLMGRIRKLWVGAH